jgi:hypothetical protein
VEGLTPSVVRADPSALEFYSKAFEPVEAEEEAEDPLLLPLTEEQEQRVDDALGPGNGSEILATSPFTSASLPPMRTDAVVDGSQQVPGAGISHGEVMSVLAGKPFGRGSVRPAQLPQFAS